MSDASSLLSPTRCPIPFPFSRAPSSPHLYAPSSTIYVRYARCRRECVSHTGFLPCSLPRSPLAASCRSLTPTATPHFHAVIMPRPRSRPGPSLSNPLFFQPTVLSSVVMTACRVHLCILPCVRPPSFAAPPAHIGKRSSGIVHRHPDCSFEAATAAALPCPVFISFFNSILFPAPGSLQSVVHPCPQTLWPVACTGVHTRFLCSNCLSQRKHTHVSTDT